MKKVIAAGIIQVLEFDSMDEAFQYTDDLRAKDIQHEWLWVEGLDRGRQRLFITTAYDDNPLIEQSVHRIGGRHMISYKDSTLGKKRLHDFSAPQTDAAAIRQAAAQQIPNADTEPELGS